MPQKHIFSGNTRSIGKEISGAYWAFSEICFPFTLIKGS
jgi:hypothetical protein